MRPKLRKGILILAYTNALVCAADTALRKHIIGYEDHEINSDIYIIVFLLLITVTLVKNKTES